MYFKVPLLRNVVQTGPWFHNGNVKTIDEAVQLMGKYQLGRNLTAAEVTSIVAFLNALTGPIPQRFIEPQQQTTTGAAGKIDGLKPTAALRVNAEAERGE